MPDAGLEPHRTSRWILCESSNRWVRGVKRFAPQLLPPRGIPCIVAATPSDAMALLSTGGPTIILWEFRGEAIVKACECLIQTARIAPQSLQLVACAGISQRQQLALSELPVAAFLRHPEDLIRLGPMLEGYFARYGQLLD